MNERAADHHHNTQQQVITQVALIGCSAAKRDSAAPARDLYTSTLFRKAVAYAEATCDRWYVLSAKYGLVHPDEVIAPYDVRLGGPRTSTGATSPPIYEWADMVRAQLAAELRDVRGVRLVALAGKHYRTVLHPCQWPFSVPMNGLGIGQQLQFLTQGLAAASAAPHYSEGTLDDKVS